MKRVVSWEVEQRDKRKGSVFMNLAIVGPSGSGKTTSLNGLDPETTFIIDSDMKGLPWKGWRKQYNKEKGNYMASDDPQAVKKMLLYINSDLPGLAKWHKDNNSDFGPEEVEKAKVAFEKCKHINTVVIDTMNGIMLGHEMRNVHQNGFTKWVDLADFVWDIVSYSLKMRPDIMNIHVYHSEMVSDDTGMVAPFRRIKTNGRKLEKIVMESKYNVVLFANCSNNQYVFETHANNSTAKSPIGAFTSDTIENDMAKVLEALEEYR